MTFSFPFPATYAEANHLALLMHMTFAEPIAHHLGMEVIQNPLDFTDPAFTLRVDFVQPVVGDEIQQLGVKIVETLIGTQSRSGKGDQRSGRQGIFGGPLVVRSFVVVCDIVEDGVRGGTLVRSDDTWSRGSFTV